MAQKTGAVMLCLCRYACIILSMGEVSVVAQTSEKNQRRDIDKDFTVKKCIDVCVDICAFLEYLNMLFCLCPRPL